MNYSRAIDCGDVIYVIDYDSDKETSKFDYEQDPQQSFMTSFHRLFLTNFPMQQNNLSLYKVDLHYNEQNPESVVDKLINEISNTGCTKFLMVIEPFKDTNTVSTYIITDKIVNTAWNKVTRQIEQYFNENIVVSIDITESEYFFGDRCGILEKCLNIIYKLQNRKDISLKYKDIIKYRGLTQSTIYTSSKVKQFVKDKKLLDFEYYECFTQNDKNGLGTLTFHFYSNISKIDLFYIKNNQIKMVDRIFNQSPIESTKILTLC